MKKHILNSVILLAICFSSSSRAKNSDYEYFMGESESGAKYEETVIIDPLEPINRKVFAFNMALDRMIIYPYVSLYTTIVPIQGRKMVGSFFTTMGYFTSSLNDLVQFKFENSIKNLMKFTLNIVFGFFGIADVSNAMCIEADKNSFSKTLAFYGVKDGPYLVVPVLGSSSFRELTGFAVDMTTNYPYNQIHVVDRNRLTGLRFTDFETRKKDVLKEVMDYSLDPYAIVRSVYFQKYYNRK